MYHIANFPTKKMKLLDLAHELTGLDGEPIIKDAKTKEVMTLRDVLLSYIASANQMGVKEHERGILFDIGMKIGTESGQLPLSQSEYDAIKRLTDDGTVKNERGAQYIYGFVVSEQAKKIVNAAENESTNDSYAP